MHPYNTRLTRQGYKGQKKSWLSAVLPYLELSLALGLLTYCILSISIGPSGFISYQQLAQQKRDMQENLQLLQKQHTQLNYELDSLKTTERATIEARSLGYLQKSEVELVLQNWNKKTPPLGAGQVIYYAHPNMLGDALIKEISLGVSLLLLVFLTLPLGAGSPTRKGNKISLRGAEIASRKNIYSKGISNKPVSY